MIDRTTLDLRLAEHYATTARVNAGDWRRQGHGVGHPIRAALAGVLLALAARLDPARTTPAGASGPLVQQTRA